MKVSHRFSRITIGGFFLMMVMLVSSPAQDGLPVKLRFFDSATGLAVENVQLAVLDRSTGQVVPVPALSGEFINAANIALLPGRYQLAVQAEGYRPLNTRLNIRDEIHPEMHLFLDPRELPLELSEAYLNAIRPGNATVLNGFLSDQESGQPLTGVKVYDPDLNQPVYSDGQGYFQLELSADREYGTLRFEKAGFVTLEYRHIRLWPGGDWQLPVRLEPGEGVQVEEQSREFRETVQCDDCETPAQDAAEGETETGISENLVLPPIGAVSIRVGRNCGGGALSCTTVEVYSMQTYCKRVLPSEWFACWGSLFNGMNSLLAGAVAIRSYATWHVKNPLTSNYDICDNTFCQFFGSTTSSNSNVAVDQTIGYVLVNSSDVIPRAEYSAENNNKGCGNGYSGTGTSWPCIYDPVCLNMTPNGHGRGMCQWGSIRWANGTVVSSASGSCSQGPAHAYGTKTWEEILNHYYPDYQVVEGVAADLVDLTPIPQTIAPGGLLTLEYKIEALPALDLLLGASVKPAASGNWVSDPPNDLKVSLNAGVNTVSRQFQLGSSINSGLYHVWATLWYDRDGDDMISSADEMMDTQFFFNAFTVGITGVEPGEPNVAGTYQLLQNYPNPFNPVTTIGFTLPEAGHAALKIFDALGREVAVLLDRPLAPGSYEIPWNAGNFSAGIYFYTLTVGEAGSGITFWDTKKLILAK